MRLKATAVRQISNASGEIYLFDLYKNKDEFYNQPCLVFEKAKSETIWDNPEYVFNFLRRLKKNKKSAKMELKEFCEHNSLSFEDTKEDLLDIFSDSETLRFWKKDLK